MPTAEPSHLVNNVRTPVDVVGHPAQHELTFRQMVDGISALVAVLTPDGAVEFVNRQVLDYFGKTLEELKAWTSTDAVHPEDRAAAIAVWTRSVETGQPYDIELRQRRADGIYRWFHVQGLPVRDAQGHIIRWCVLQTDIEDRKHAEAAQHETERELRQLVDNVPGMIAVADAQGHSEYVNKRAIDYLDTTIEEVRARPMDTVHPEDQELLRNEWLRCNASGQPLDLVHRVRRFDGVYRWVHVRGEPLLDDQGRIVRWYYVFTDIDDQRRAEEALRQSEQHLRLVVETIPALVARSTAQGRLEYVNRRVVDYLGKELGEIGLRALHPDDRHARGLKWRHAWKTGEPWEDTFRLRRADGA